jgi:glutamate-1-semialdehyde 2,1-aminomutase
MNETINVNSLVLYSAGGLVLLSGLRRVKDRVELSLAKHRSLAGHPRNARRLAAYLPSYHYDVAEALQVDGAPDHVVDRRKIAFDTLLTKYRTLYPLCLQETADVVNAISDLQFTGAYRVPFQFSDLVGKGLKIGSFIQSTSGVTMSDLDGNQFYDLTGSYGVNLFGNDFYKTCIDQGADMVRQLGPVLGSYHPVVTDNVHRLKNISGLDEISFHMSGTEAVMQAVRLARYHSRRSKIVRFCGSYHGWWGDVQPGIGNPVTEKDTFTLSEMSAATLRVLRNRNDIACVLVNPLQALHPNVAAPSDSSLLDSTRKAGFSKAAYITWLQELRQVCDSKGIALIFDEVFVGFRLAPGGAQEYFGVQADMVTYGKTLGGGLPVGVLCGKATWMKRFRDDAPGDVCFARGTFNSHPYVMGAMNVFLRSLETPSVREYYTDIDETWNARAQSLNTKFTEANIPVQVANLSSIWTVIYTQPACYNWMFQYYLRLEGIALSWVGTGRIIFSLNYTQDDFDRVAECFIRAAKNMQNDGWWWGSSMLTNKSIKRRIFRELLRAKIKPAN